MPQLFSDTDSTHLASCNTGNVILIIGASREQLDDTSFATERAVMSSIFKFAFYPNGNIDMERDR